MLNEVVLVGRSVKHKIWVNARGDYHKIHLIQSLNFIYTEACDNENNYARTQSDTSKTTCSANFFLDIAPKAAYLQEASLHSLEGTIHIVNCKQGMPWSTAWNWKWMGPLELCCQVALFNSFISTGFFFPLQILIKKLIVRIFRNFCSF